MNISLIASVHNWDISISKKIYTTRNTFFNTFFKFITNFGEPVIVFALPLTAGILYMNQAYRTSTFFLYLSSLGLFLDLFLKTIFKRPRPNIDPLIKELYYSFPSGHSMSSMIFYGFGAYLLLNMFPFVTFGLMLLIGLIGYSRIYLGVHYPSDVIAGYTIGVVVLLIGINLFQNPNIFPSLIQKNIW